MERQSGFVFEGSYWKTASRTLSTLWPGPSHVYRAAAFTRTHGKTHTPRPGSHASRKRTLTSGDVDADVGNARGAGAATTAIAQVLADTGWGGAS